MAITLGKPAIINGVAYAHSDITVNILGVPSLGVTEISYSDPQEITGNHANGQKYSSVGFGTVSPVGSITLEMAEVERLTKIAPGGYIQNIPFFDIGVTFITEDGNIARHRLVSCRFKGRNVSSSTGNMQLTEALELFVADIKYDAA